MLEDVADIVASLVGGTKHICLYCIYNFCMFAGIYAFFSPYSVLEALVRYRECFLWPRVAE